METKVNDGGELFNTLLSDFEEHGASAIEELRKANPLEYLKLIASIVQEEIRTSYGKRKDQGKRQRG